MLFKLEEHGWIKSSASARVGFNFSHLSLYELSISVFLGSSGVYQGLSPKD